MNNIYLAGLLARFLFMPSHHAIRVTVAKCKQIPLLRMKLTATGIAPVSHRTSLLTPDTGDQTLQMYRVVLRSRRILFSGCRIKIQGESDKIIGRRSSIVIPAGSGIDIVTKTVFRVESIIDAGKNSKV
jgi:hypothetical protein